MLPDALDLLDERSREAYVGILIHVAAADGDLVREESAATVSYTHLTLPTKA